MHACFGFFFAGLNHLVPKAKFVPGMVIVTSVCLTVELLRYRKGFGGINDLMHFLLGSSLRKHEMDGKFTGSLYYFLGVTLTAALYPTSCATLGICQLAIADPTASFFGSHTRHVYWSRIEK
jgi:dolichol kinase